MPSHSMKWLIPATICAVTTHVCICCSLFTQDWVEVSGVALQASVSSGIFPWECVSSNTCNVFWDTADGWDKCFFFLMLFAWIFQFFVLITAAVALFVPRLRYNFTSLFHGIQGLVFLLLGVEVILYGIKYDRNLGGLEDIFGVTVTLGYSYWFSTVAVMLAVSAVGMVGEVAA
ncbi:hypothetical protein V3C99_017505, partial [Haemonchus contortus]